MNILRPRAPRARPGRPQRKVNDHRAEQLRTLAEWTLSLLDFPWGYDSHSDTYTELRAGQLDWQALEVLAGKCVDLELGSQALSAWLDIAPDSAAMPSVLRPAAEARG